MERKLKFHLASYQDMRELSMMAFSYMAIFVLCLCTVDGHVHLNYSEVERFGNSCPRLDSCEFQRLSGLPPVKSFKERNCACDYRCSEYGDCCIDAPGIEINKHPNSLKCYYLKEFGGVFMKDNCPLSYTGPEDVKELCEKTEIGDTTDPLGSMPVTDSMTGMTYKNYYCSMCNDKSDNIVLWTPRLECPLLTLLNTSKNLTEEYIVQNLASDGQSWGVYVNGENGSLFFHDCDVDPFLPLPLEKKIRFCKPNLVSDCPFSWGNDDVRTMCRSYMGAKFVHGGNGYKNAHCAVCNNVNATHLSCQSAELRGFEIFRYFTTHSFALLLDINEKQGQEVGMVRVCENGDVYDPFFKRCRSLTCLPGYIRQDRKCLKPSPMTSTAEPRTTDDPIISIHTNFSEPKNNVSYEHVLTNSKGMTPDFESFNGSDDALGKYHSCLLISLVDEDYVMFPNKSMYVPKYNRLYEPTAYHTDDGSVLVCTHFDTGHDTKFVPILGYVTIFGLGISMFFLLLHFAAFCVVPDLRNLSGKNLVSQCAALFCAYLCFIVGQFESMSFTSCSAAAFLTFYFFQVSFFWMAAMAYDVWRTLKMATTELRVSTGKQLKRFASYSLFTWMTPAFITIVLAFAEYTEAFPEDYRPGFASPRCWFKRRRALLVFFAAPLFAIMLANVALFFSSARMIVMTTQTSLKQQNKTQRRNFKLYLRLALLMGLTWATGIIAGYVDVSILWYLFVVLNTLQGLFIFIAFSCSSKVLNYLQNKFKMTAKPKEFKSSTHTASTGSSFNTKPTTVFVSS